jgi:uncharacterized protein (DUF488 family)
VSRSGTSGHASGRTGTLLTVGHGTRSTDALVAVLRAGGAQRVVDVRRFPGSRRHPHFGREPLAVSLTEAGLAYDWRGEALGGRRRSVEPSRHPALRVAAFRGFADHMDTPVFRAGLAALLDEVATGPPTAVLCAETLWWRCHRRLIADAAVLAGTPVVHLVDERTRTPHVLSADARPDEEGRPVYDVGVLPA